jgi:hypothetical protein
MATKEQKIEIARALYLAGKNEEEIATIAEITKRTVQNYKSSDAKIGKDWDVLRAIKHLNADPAQRENLYGNFVDYMHQSIMEVKDSSLTSLEKAELTVKLADAFTKMRSVIRQEDPVAYKHSIIKHVVGTIGKSIKERGEAKCLSQFIEIIDQIGDKLDVAF